MAMKDIFATTDARLAFSKTIAPSDGNSAVEGDAVDTSGFNAAVFAVSANFESVDDGTFSLSVKHSDDNETFEDALPEHIVGPSAEISYAAPVQKIGYVGARQYVKLVVTPVDTLTGNATITAHAVLQHPAVAPV